MDRLKHVWRTLILPGALLVLLPASQVGGCALPAVLYARNAAPAPQFPLQYQPPEAVASAAALPPLNTVLARVLERARKEEQNDRGFQLHYAFKRSKLTEERDARGTLEKRKQNESQHVPNPRQETTEPTPPPASAKTLPPSNPTLSKRPVDRKDFPLNQELLNRFQFTLVRRDFLHDRPTLVLDFKPSQSRPPAKSLKDLFLNKVAGRLWIDESEWVLVQTDVRLIQSVSVAAGLVVAVKSLWYHFDRERTVDGYWFTTAVKWHVELREFLVHKILDYAEQTGEVKRVQ